MRTGVWFSNYGIPNKGLDFPYIAQSPVTGKKTKYKEESDVLNEIEILLKQTEGKKYSIGQSLYYQLPFFCDPSKFISDWVLDMITDYFAVKSFNVPLSDNLENINPWVLDCFSIIENEINNIKIHEREKHGS